MNAAIHSPIVERVSPPLNKVAMLDFGALVPICLRPAAWVSGSFAYMNGSTTKPSAPPM